MPKRVTISIHRRRNRTLLRNGILRLLRRPVKQHRGKRLRRRPVHPLGARKARVRTKSALSRRRLDANRRPKHVEQRLEWRHHRYLLSPLRRIICASLAKMGVKHNRRNNCALTTDLYRRHGQNNGVRHAIVRAKGAINIAVDYCPCLFPGARGCDLCDDICTHGHHANSCNSTRQATPYPATCRPPT